MTRNKWDSLNYGDVITFNSNSGSNANVDVVLLKRNKDNNGWIVRALTPVTTTNGKHMYMSNVNDKSHGSFRITSLGRDRPTVKLKLVQ